MKPKIVFFDIDDTLLLNRNGSHIVPESAKTALRSLKAQGVLTAIATGRTIAVLPETVRNLIDECGIDLIVSINGQYVEYRNRPLAAFDLERAQVEQVSGSLNAHGIAHALVTREGLFTLSENQYSVSAMAALGLPYCHDPQAAAHYAVYQMLVFYPEAQDAAVQQLLPEQYQIIRWHPHGTDWLDKHGSKARGIRAALAELGLTMADAMAFGDGANDMEMIRQVGFGVAMGNAVPQLKAVADYVCPPIEEDGVYRALLDLGVIQAA